ncbi:MAG TPA: FAD-dependent oxidoreductase [Ruminiclostridium sp.]
MSEKILHINSEEFEAVVLKSEIPVIVDFYSDECPPCEVLAPIFEKMVEKYGDHIKFVKIFRQKNKEFAKSINVTGSPTVLFFINGKEVGQRLSGFMNKPQVRKAIEEVLGDVIPKGIIKRVDCDVIILGAGAAGLSAAIYASRAKMNTVVIDESIPGGQTGSTYHVANYPGTPGVVRGKEITENMRNQALSFGTVIEDLKEIFVVELIGDIKHIGTEDIDFYAKAVIIASGAQSRPLPAEGAEDFKGRGVHYCATCDGAMYQDRKIIVVGGGSSAIEEAVYLTKFASHITIIHRSDKFRATKTALEEARSNQKIDIITNAIVKKVNGSGHALTSVILENIKTGELTELPTEGAFVYIGTDPITGMFSGQVEIDEIGYIVASEDTKTNIPGVFVAGDVITKQIRQIVTAASDGAVAGIMAERYVINSKS